MERERIPKHIGFEDFSPVWQPFAQEEIPGLFYTAARLSNPKLEIWAIKADLAEPALKITVNGGREGDISESGRILSTKVSSFVRDRGLLAGINTVPFDPVSAKEGEERTCAGIVVSGGVMTSLPSPAYDALVFYKDSKNPANGGIVPYAAILPQSEINNPDLVENAVGGFHIILNEGELPDRLVSANNAPRHPRSAAGLSADGRFLYLLVIDGRRKGSIGATEAETGLILKKLGAVQGLNFDGGGSSALALRFPDGRVRIVNTAIHSGIPGRERAVAACLGFGAVEKQ